MYTLNTSMLPTLPTTPQASVASMIMPSTPVLGRLPAAQVAGAVPEPEIRNEAQNNPPYITLPSDISATASSFSDSAAPSSDTTISVFPSLFLAQLIGQGGSDPQTMSVIASYTPAGNAQAPPAVNGNASLMQLQSVQPAPPGNGNNTPAAAPAPPVETTVQAVTPQAAALPQPTSTAPATSAPRRESGKSADAAYTRKIQAYLKPQALEQVTPAEEGFEPSLA